MTRVNADLKFNKLSDQLILSELGEITRVFHSVIKKIDQQFDIPETFRMGAGHEKYFYNKCDFILDRYLRLRAEYKIRTGKEYSKEHLKTTMLRHHKIQSERRDLCGWYVMTPEDEETILERLKMRAKGYKRTHTYFGEPVDCLELLNR